jgi:hypothetical protein
VTSVSFILAFKKALARACHSFSVFANAIVNPNV